MILIELTTIPDGRIVLVNADHIISIRVDQLVDEDKWCSSIKLTGDNYNINVQENPHEIHDQIWDAIRIQRSDQP